jgi:hypothetical protein
MAGLDPANQRASVRERKIDVFRAADAALMASLPARFRACRE